MSLSSEAAITRSWQLAPLATPAAMPLPETGALESAGQRAQHILSQARAEAEALLAAARAEAERLARKAEAEGRERGLVEGRRQAEVEVGAVRDEARRLVRQARQERRRVLDALRGEVAGLALAVAERVLEREVEQQPEDVVRLAQRLVRRLEGPITVRVHPSLAPVLEAETVGNAAAVRIRPDTAVRPGGLVVESEEGILDATLEGRLRRVGAALGGEAHAG